MSAYIVSREHINYLVSAALSRKLSTCQNETKFRWFHNGWRELPFGDYPRAAEVGQMLWDENIKSVHERYPDDELDELPGPCEESYVFTFCAALQLRKIDPVQVLKACSCYEYQSCEHDEWEASEARAFIESLKSSAIHALPGYEEARWEISAA